MSADASAAAVGQAGVVCLVERDGAEIADSSLRALAFAASLAGTDGVTAVLFADTDAAGAVEAAGELADLIAGAGASGLTVVSSAELAGYSPAAWARSLEQIAAGAGASAVVAAATDRGNEVLAHLGAVTSLPVAVNCIAVRPSGPGSWQLVRQRWAGSVLEDAVLEAPCALLTVATDSLAVGTIAGPRPVVSYFRPELTPADLVVVAAESAERSSGMSLATARVVVGGGRGVGGPEGFAALEELAGLLGGVVGVSRVVTSQGWRPHRQQVGQTGTKISPELYLACGISGAIQHMAGCQTARHIVAVNTDADAPIIAHAEYAVIGDLNEIVPALVAAIRARSG
jgi:electron transfer flavoprotein alpha subunit